MIAHGHARTTVDLDLMIRRDDRERWLKLAGELGYSAFREGGTFVQFNPDDKEKQPLDLMMVNNETFRKLMAEAVSAPPTLSGAKMVSLRHLLALKCHAIKFGHSGRIGKDLEDVLELVRINSINVNAPDVRALLLKHGTEELYERVKRASQRSRP